MAKFANDKEEKEEQDETLKVFLENVYDFNSISRDITKYLEEYFDKNAKNMRKNEIHDCSTSIGTFKNFCKILHSYVFEHPEEDKCPHCDRSL